MRNLRLLVFSIFFLTFAAHAQQGYEIKVKIKGAENDTLLLGHHFANTQLIPDDTLVTNSKGEGVFTGKDKLPGGMYFIFLPTKTYFDFLIDKDQHFYLENDTADLLANLVVKDNLLNTEFAKYQQLMSSKNKEARALVEARKTADENQKQQINAQLQEINNQVDSAYSQLEQNHPNLFLTTFLRATREITVPESILSQEDKYYYYRNNYFDNFDISDARLLRTPIYQNKITTFFTKVIVQHPDTLIKEADRLIEASKGNKELFRFMLVHLFNTVAKNQIMGMENVYVHLADKYYIPYADWSDEEFTNDLKIKIERKKNCLLYGPAKEITVRKIPNNQEEIAIYVDEIQTITDKGNEFKKLNPNITDQELIRGYADLHEEFMNNNGYSYLSSHQNNPAKFTILWFWDPTCSHCKKDTPPFHEKFVSEYKDKGVVLFSIYLQRSLMEWEKYNEHLQQWFDFINENKLYGWINAWDNYNVSNFRENYDISSSPVLYLLDKDKNIIAKRISYEQAFSIIDEELKKQENK